MTTTTVHVEPSPREGWWHVITQYPGSEPSMVAGMRNKSRAVDHAQTLAAARGWRYTGVQEVDNGR